MKEERIKRLERQILKEILNLRMKYEILDNDISFIYKKLKEKGIIPL